MSSCTDNNTMSYPLYAPKHRGEITGPNPFCFGEPSYLASLLTLTNQPAILVVSFASFGAKKGRVLASKLTVSLRIPLLVWQHCLPRANVNVMLPP